MQNNWYAPLRSIRSLGSQKTKIANMGELAEQRRRHLGQFFTPDAIAAFMWSFVQNLTFRTILDNSIGSARLVQFADPEKHTLLGVDVHEDSVNAVKAAVSAAGFECEIEHAGMEDIHPRNIDVALINPPFSIHLESPFLEAFHGCTRMGRFGAHSSATSEEYALHQALNACKIVVALMPTTAAERLLADPQFSHKERLRAVFDLAPDSFEEENANVSTSIMVFGEWKYGRNFHRQAIVSWADEVPDLGLATALTRPAYGAAKLRLQKLDPTTPTITLPVTGNSDVVLGIAGRRLTLKYQCGLVQAKVANAILRTRIFSTDTHRLPKGVHYAGEGALDIELHLMQDDPLASFHDLLALVRDHGGNPIVQPNVLHVLIKRIRRHRLQACPVSHVVWSRGAASAEQLVGKARKTHNVDASMWLSPVIKQGEEVQFSRNASGTFTFSKAGAQYTVNADDLEARFELAGAAEDWHTVHAGLLKQFPQHAQLLRKRAHSLGLHQWLTWNFQLDDTIELSMKPRGAIAAWKQACGKSRLAMSLVILSGMKAGLIVLESRLIDEMLQQFEKVGIARDQVNVIDAPEKLTQLQQINLISYERLRMPVASGSKATYAKKLRGRFGIVVADEGEKLANISSDQSRALFQLNPKKRYVLTGTPIANYPRDTHGLMLWVGGDGTASQPYGFHRGFMEQSLMRSMKYARRGIDAVRDDFVVVEWVTWEFAETLRDGAKREIPKIANVEKFRAWLAPLMKRRILEEPEVAKFITLPPVVEKTISVKWDQAHLGLYLKVADEFVSWYRNSRDERTNNLAILLAKLQAVQKALNCPQESDAGHMPFTGLTSKQRVVLDTMVEIAVEGKKSILFAENPSTVKLLHKELKERGVGSVPFHGGIAINKRVDQKNKLFRNGNVPHLLATKATARAGYNEPQADYVLFYDQSWSHRIMDQAMRRPLRPERKTPLTVCHFVIEGSLDEYQAQMVAFKKDSASAGLDWATPELEDEEFLHLGTILDRFVKELARLEGRSSRELREELKRAA